MGQETELSLADTVIVKIQEHKLRLTFSSAHHCVLITSAQQTNALCL